MSRLVRFEKNLKENNGKKKIAIGYVRVSTKQQVQEGISLKAQEKAIIEYCKNHGFKLNPNHIFRDEGKSAYARVSRQGFNQAMFHIRNKRCNAVVVYDMSRWSRNFSKTAETWKTMKEKNVEFISVTEPFFTTDNEYGELIQIIIAKLAEIQSTAKSRRVKHSKNLRAEKVVYNGSFAPMGYRLIKNKNGRVIEPFYEKLPKTDPMRKKIERLFDMYKRNQGLRCIHNRLGFSSPQANNILKNPIYCGLLTYNLGSNAIIKEGNFESYIPVTQYNANQRRRRRNNSNPKRRSPSFTIHHKNNGNGSEFYLRELP